MRRTATTVLTVPACTYNVTEPTVAGYATSLNNCSNLVIPNGGTATCTITNGAVPTPTPTPEPPHIPTSTPTVTPPSPPRAQPESSITFCYMDESGVIQLRTVPRGQFNASYANNPRTTKVGVTSLAECGA